MKILVIADSENNELWSGNTGLLPDGIELILSAGDLAPSYLEYLVTITNLPLLYVRGNHDSIYDSDPPQGCIAIDDRLAEVYYDRGSGRALAVRVGRSRRVSELERDMLSQLMPAWEGELPGQPYSGSGSAGTGGGGLVWGGISRRERMEGGAGVIRIAGLGGSMRYRRGSDMYTEAEMASRVRQMDRRLRLLAAHGQMMGLMNKQTRRPLDILLTHAPCLGYGDMEDLPHRGFECFNTLLGRWKPSYHCYGHVHREYGNFERELQHPSGAVLLNACGYCVIEW